MLFWLIIVAFATLVGFLLLAGFRRRQTSQEPLDGLASDMAVYRDQLREVERDLERGVLGAEEAETVRLEVSRRLLEADRRQSRAGGKVASASSSHWPVITLTVLAMVGAAFVYDYIGAPGYGDQPLSARLERSQELLRSRPDQAAAETAASALSLPADAEPEFLELMERLRAALDERPDDAQGLRLLARNEARLGNYAAARAAQARLIEVLGEDAMVTDYAGLLDVTVAAAGGIVTAEADRLIDEILSRAPGNGTAVYYAGLSQAQIGRADLAFPLWRRLWEDSPDGAPWLPVLEMELPLIAREAGVRYEMPSRRGPSREDIAAASEMSAEDRGEMIRGMVNGLSERLASDGGPPSDWARLITALGVLGETDRARAIAAEAREVFAGNGAALGQIAEAEARIP